MGTIHVALCEMRSRNQDGSPMPLAASIPAAVETQDTTTTSARVGTLAAANGNQVWIITSRSADIYVRMSQAAASNAAGPDQGHLIPAGSTQTFGVTSAGEQIAARDA